MAITARPGLADIKPYKSGEASIEGRDSVFKLSANENPLGPSPKAVAAFKECLGGLNLYPSSDHSALRQAISERLGIDSDLIVCGNGSDEILGLLAQAFAEPGAEIVHTKHGFLMYPIFARSVGAQPIEAEEANRQVNVRDLLAACSPRTRLVYLANPSNPTGNRIERGELEWLADHLPPHIILVIDGAYAEFNEPADGSLDLATSRPNVVTTRTFSKIYGLAALRVGYGIGPRPIMDAIARMRAPFNVNGPAQAAAIASLKDHKYMRHSQSFNRQWRQWLRRRLEASGVKCDDSSANFLLARFDDSETALDCDQWLRKDGILVRRMESYQLPHCLRISIGSETANRAVTDSIDHFMRR